MKSKAASSWPSRWQALQVNDGVAELEELISLYSAQAALRTGNGYVFSGHFLSGWCENSTTHTA